jgi:hypothetical protein
MKEKRDQKDDRQWNAEQPKKRTLYGSHPGLLPKGNRRLQFWFRDSLICFSRRPVPLRIATAPSPALSIAFGKSFGRWSAIDLLSLQGSTMRA